MHNVNITEQGQADNKETRLYRVVGFWIRFFAYLIDLIVISTLFFIIYSSVGLLFSISLKNVHWLGIGAISIGLVGFLYFAVMTKLFSQTLGKMIFGIKVIRKDGRNLDWATVIYREIVGRTVSQLFGLHLGYLWIIFNSQKKGWHDSISDTYVVSEEDIELARWITFKEQAL